MSQSIDVDVNRESGGWRCTVQVRENGTATRHSVLVTDEAVSRLGAGRTPEQLVRRSFEFLLQREPKESILPSFALTEIARYFPEYEREMTR
jgi:hypothetical protein